MKACILMQVIFFAIFLHDINRVGFYCFLEIPEPMFL